MKGIYEKVPGSGEWWVRFADSTGKIRREKAGTKAAAKQLYQIRKAASLQGQKLPHTLRAKAVTFGDLAKTALEYSAAHKKSVEDDRERMKLLLEWFADTAADTIRPQDIEKRLRDAAKERKWKPATVNRYKAVLSLIYRIGLENGRITSNPVSLVRRLREDNHVVRYLTAEEEQRLKTVIEPKHPERWAAVLFAVNTGLRAGEQWDLIWSDLGLDSLQPQVTLSATKNGTIRHVPLNQYARDALDTLKAGDTHGARVFPQQSYRGWFELALAARGEKPRRV